MPGTRLSFIWPVCNSYTQFHWKVEVGMSPCLLKKQWNILDKQDA
uniref:Uncharacterized protein n=1 Tax=Anguilla anguilla TaxID=7936 RepID=A0A0E9URW2_ANGAN